MLPFIGSTKNSAGLAKLASLPDLLSGKYLCTIDIFENQVVVLEFRLKLFQNNLIFNDVNIAQTFAIYAVWEQ